jgi:hypothetical protein
VYAHLVDRFLRRVSEGSNRGDAERAISRFGERAQLVFHGDSRLGAALDTKDDIREWLRQLMALGLRWEIDDVVVTGPPWNTRVVTLFTVRLPQGGFYRGAQYARLRWGRVYLDEILPDTQAVRRHFPPSATPVSST